MELQVEYVGLLTGDEKGEAQVFCDRLFRAFGHRGYREAGAILEYRIRRRSTGGTSFADLVWKPRLLIEMKKRGANLYLHYRQAFDYWVNAVPDRPRYVVLCNFDEFWIYDFDKQLDEPVDFVTLSDLPLRHTALNFLFLDDPSPIFGNDREAVSREAADKVAQLFNALVARGIPREQAQRFVLQLVVAMFSEDIGLLPVNMVYGIVNDSLQNRQSAYDLFGALFRQMNSSHEASGGRFQQVPYFNGGLFDTIEPVDLTTNELLLLGGEDGASTKDWTKVHPAIFGTLFQQSMDASARHAYGAHYTSEADILGIVNPTIVRPWEERIEAASTMRDLFRLRGALLHFTVLDPACGSGNFLYVSYRELVRLEIRLLAKLEAAFSAGFYQRVRRITEISPHQFYGIDQDSFGVELAKVTLMLAKKLAFDEACQAFARQQIEVPFEDESLPLDNLDDNFICGDALFEDWPQFDAIVGNPPYQSKNKMQVEFGRAYRNKMRAAYHDIPGRADYCVYWFRKAHNHLKPGQRAGLVGTNTIRQNYSRVGGLDYIVKNGGTITEAVSSQVWPGEAVVHVSIVNWTKGKQLGKKKLFLQNGDSRDSPWELHEIDVIPSSLSSDIDVTTASVLDVNVNSQACYQGQTHGNSGFLLTYEEYTDEIRNDAHASRFIHPYLIANDLIGSKDSLPSRYVIDFEDVNILSARRHRRLFRRIEDKVLGDRQNAAQEEQQRNAEAIQENPQANVTKDHASALRGWWQLFRSRPEMIRLIQSLPRYIVCGRVTKRPIFEFIHPKIHPNDALMVFPLADDYSFGILQSEIHWVWFIHRCSTMKRDPRYTSNTVFDTFAWPQNSSKNSINRVAQASHE